MTDTHQEKFQLRAVLALVIGAALSASSIKFLQKTCEACSAAADNAPLPAADIVGAIYYCVLAAALLRFKLNRFTLFGIYAAAGFHLGLMVRLVELRLFCIPCIVCALCVGFAALCTMSRPQRLASITVLAGLAGMLISSAAYFKWQSHQMVVNTKAAIGFDRLPLQSKGALPIFVFERPNCHYCQDFDALYVPKLKSTYGQTIALHTRPAPKGITTPTVVLGGASPVLWEYRPTWKELSTAIDGELKLAGEHNNSSVAATSSAVVR